MAGVDCLVARTGYTGEDGFELFCGARHAGHLWDALLAAGSGDGLIPAGLGARDTLRLEAGMPLYGNELDRTTNPFEANLGRVVKLDKGEFIGRAALGQVQQAGPRRKLIGLVMRENAIPRSGYAVRQDGAEVGVVTSGTASPTLGEKVAMAYVPAELAAVGADLRGGGPRSPLPGRAGKVAVLQASTPGAADQMSHPGDLRYSKEHEWVRVDGSTATIGITSFAADELGDIVFIELPEVGSRLSQFGGFGVVESVKAVSDLFAPISGEVTEVNDALARPAGAAQQRRRTARAGSRGSRSPTAPSSTRSWTPRPTPS